MVSPVLAKMLTRASVSGLPPSGLGRLSLTRLLEKKFLNQRDTLVYSHVE